MTITRQTLRYHAAASHAWTVLDIFKGLPIVVGGIVMDGLPDQHFNELVDELNHEDLETRASCATAHDVGATANSFTKPE